MSSWDGKTRGGLTGYRIFVFILKTFGIRSAYFLLRFVSFHFFLFSRKTNRHIRYYFCQILGYGKLKANISIYRNYYKLGQVLIDKIAVMAGLGKRYSYHMDGEENLIDMQDGGLLISAHIGSWEIAGNFLYRVKKRFNIVMLDEEHQKIKNYLDDMLLEKDLHVIPIKDDLSHILAIKKALDNKELIAIHADRYIEGSKIIKHKFLGKDAIFPEGPFYLAARFKAPVSFVFAVKENNSHYHFFATPAKVYDIGAARSVKEEDLLPVIKDYISEMERILREYPLQWFNYHRFWEKDTD
ncbi:MAG: lipid A biosynthesis acyltransferase [Bacteroidetes bacterium]|nr:lipid A biosynthesis acyltransferase [Bacteroidota bacterium]